MHPISPYSSTLKKSKEKRLDSHCLSFLGHIKISAAANDNCMATFLLLPITNNAIMSLTTIENIYPTLSSRVFVLVAVHVVMYL